MNYLILVDFVSPDIELRFNKRTNLKTSFGGILTLLILGAILYTSWSFGKDIIYKENPNLLALNKINPIRKEKILDIDHMPIAIALQDANNKLFKDPSYISFSVQYIEVNNKYGTWDPKDLEIEACTNKNFPKFQENFINDSGISKYNCIKNQNVTIQGYWNEEVMKVLYISFGYCKNSTKNSNSCQSIEKINHFLDNNSLVANLYIMDNIFDVSDFNNPFKYYINNIYKGVIKNTLKYNEINIKLNSIYSDTGIIFENPSKKDSLSISKSDLDLSNSNEHLVIFSIVSGAEESVLHRVYIKIQTIGANLGGIIKLLFLCGYYISYYFSSTYKEVEILNVITEKINKAQTFFNLNKDKRPHQHGKLLRNRKFMRKEKLTNKFKLSKKFSNLLQSNIAFKNNEEEDEIKQSDVVQFNPRTEILDLMIIKPIILTKKKIEPFDEKSEFTQKFSSTHNNQNCENQNQVPKLKLTILEMMVMLLSCYCFGYNNEIKYKKDLLNKYKFKIYENLDLLNLIRSKVRFDFS